ncbi:efflux RND transporter periplasmic adaptor subunit [Thalassoglobus sp. JC818]|uniref:efflux RND transporter periplasmic adaptor subunit n=1 Tax=Thalassoglobus sp. JC818 TaxID=3232136 RepID=UPI003458C25F
MTVAEPIVMTIVEWDAYTGRLEAVEFVEVRARVGGYIQAIPFDEGQVVEKGDLLFVIDPRPFTAELNRAEAAANQARSQSVEAQAKLKEAEAIKLQSDAQLELAQTRVHRARRLAQNNATSQEEVDQREAEFLQAQADVEASKAGISSAEAAIETAEAAFRSAEAGIETAQLNLEYTRIHAPVDGRISRKFVTKGNLVSGGTATSTLLTTITSVDPIYCVFDANEQEVLKYTRLDLAGKRASSRKEKNPVYLRIVDEEGFPHAGHMDFVDNQIDSDTASMRARAVFSNEDKVLVPGMFARIRIPGSAAYEAILIPDSAVGTDQSSQFVYIVENGSIVPRSVELGPIVHGLRVVRDGLDAGDQLVIEGMILARPGMEVQTQPGEIEVVEDGLPNKAEPWPPEKWISPEPDQLPEPLSFRLQQKRAETEQGGEIQ